MPDDVTQAPRPGIAPGWLWLLAVPSMLAAIVAAAFMPPVRPIAWTAAVLLALPLPFLAAALMPQMAAVRTTEAPRDRRVLAAQSALVLAYMLGLVTAVLMALSWFTSPDTPPRSPLLQTLPALMGIMPVLIALLATLRYRHGREAARPWYVGAHGFWMVVVALLAAVAALALLAPEAWTLGRLVVHDGVAMFLGLLFMLGLGTHALLALDLPSPVDLPARFLQARRDDDEGFETRKPTPPIVYAVVVGLAAVVAGWFLLRNLDLGLAQQIRGLGDEDALYLLLAFPIGLAAFLGYSLFGVWRQGRQGLYKKRVPTKLRNDIAVYGFSSLAGLAVGGLAILAILGRIDGIGPLAFGPETPKDLIVLTIVITVGPIGIYMQRQTRRVDDIESRLPDFLNDLAESRRAGLTLASALRNAAHTDYGLLTPEVRRMSHQVGWGLPLTEALQQFADRVPTAMVRRSVSLIIEASRTGGSVSDILRAAAQDAYEIKNLEADRRVTLTTYLIVIYVTFFVFMVVIAVLDARFIPQVLAAQEGQNVLEGDFGGGTDILGDDPGIDRSAFRFTYFTAAIVQAIGNGIVGGVLTENRVTSGFRHVAIMTLSAWLVFRFILALL